MHTVLSQNPAQQNSTHSGIGVTATAPEMLATADVVRHFDRTGDFNVSPAVAAGAGSALAAVQISEPASPRT